MAHLCRAPSRVGSGNAIHCTSTKPPLQSPSPDVRPVPPPPPPMRGNVTWPKKHRKHQAPKALKKIFLQVTLELGLGATVTWWPSPPESANLAANESLTRFTRLGGRDQNFGGWHKIKPIYAMFNCVVIIPFCMALLSQCCTQHLGFWHFRRISPTSWAPCRLRGGAEGFVAL